MQNYLLEREVKKTVLTRRSPLSRRRSALDCSATEEKEEEESGKTFYMRNLCTGKLNTILTSVLSGLEKSSLLHGKTLFSGNTVHLSFQ